jgi:DNA topoisomerase-2
VPYTRGFKGSISKVNAKEFCVKGLWKVEKDMMTITELPVGTWTSDFREWLEKLVSDGAIKEYSDTSTDTDILIKVKLGTEGGAPVEKLLTDKIKLSNMHLFNSDCVIKKYESPNEILSEFVGVRLDMYGKRREFMLKAMKDRLPYHENVVRFIKQQCEKDPLPDLRRKTPEECDSLLGKQKFAKISESFDYLMNLPIASLTLKNATKHERDLEELREKIKVLESTTPKQMWKAELEKLKI